jgi:hypothetical protein
MNTDQLDAEKIRADILKAPDPASVAIAAQKAAQERRVINSRLNKVEIDRYNKLFAALEQNNAQLITFGDPAIEFAAADPLELHWPELQQQIAVLGQMVRQQSGRLDYFRARAAAAERERMIANETPADRGLRLLSERLVPMESRIADLEAQVAELRKDQEFVPPDRPPPPMSGVPASMGDGLCAQSAMPPSRGGATGAPVRRR